MRKNLLLATALGLLTLLGAGCIHAGQVPSNPTVYTCPSASTGAWIQLDTGATEVAGTSSKDTPGAGAWCYTVESANNTYSPVATSVPSNVAMATATTADPVVNLSWMAPTSSAVPVTGYIRYRIAAISATITAPTQNAPTTAVSSNAKEDAGTALAMASNLAPPLKLRAAGGR